MNLRKTCLCLLLCAAVCLLCLPFGAGAYVPDLRLTSGHNENGQSYGISANPIYSYLTETAEGELMRLQVNQYSSQEYIYVEYYDKDYRFLRALAIEPELFDFGGFYATDSNYYILSGQSNPKESPDVECFRITKYDLNWKRLASVGLYDCNTTTPFRAGSARMTHAGKYLLVRTSHRMYKASDGRIHQANVTIEVDTETMSVTDSYTKVSNNSYGYVSHSFNQFIQIEENHIVAVDHGDAHPRGIALIRYPSDVSTGRFVAQGCQVTNLVEFPGNTGENDTGASVGGFEISDSSYLVAYNSVPLDENFRDYTTRNICVAAMDKKTGKVTNRQFTHLTEADMTTSTPHLVKLSEDSFVLMWSRTQDRFMNGIFWYYEVFYDVYYVFLNGKGEAVSEIYCTKDAALSDCAPIIVDGKAVWYTYMDGVVTFYEIDPASPSKINQRTLYSVGDINDNGVIDAMDYMLLKRYCLGTSVLTDAQKAVADVDGDGKINGTDYMLVKRHVLGTYRIT